ncbi:cyclase family protein [Demequina salsinemoris]|uniref:cyclase family protein n=1 Tax=Demequina salsinemoris TaxID=577470 RepID=UPI0007855E08|nr:cyclase family protein [Demequina salsinemoris]
MTLVDLSHALEEGVETYPGFPTPTMNHFISFEDSKEMAADGIVFAIDDIRLIGGSSTYMDAPRHFLPEGGDVASIPLEKTFDLPLVVVSAPADGRRELLPEDFAGLELAGAAVLIRTGWDARWATPEYVVGSPFLGGAAAAMLVEAGVTLVGIDAVLIDDVEDGPLPTRPAHSTLLAAGLPIVENLRGLAALPETGARFFAVPAAVKGVGSFPVRAFAAVQSGPGE